jgi:hypothetical protein
MSDKRFSVVPRIGTTRRPRPPPDRIPGGRSRRGKRFSVVLLSEANAPSRGVVNDPLPSRRGLRKQRYGEDRHESICGSFSPRGGRKGGGYEKILKTDKRFSVVNVLKGKCIARMGQIQIVEQGLNLS